MGKALIALVFLTCPMALTAQQAGSCRVIHGRAHLYGGDGQLRIWHIGTHHDYQPDGRSWRRLVAWIEAGVTEPEKQRWAAPDSALDLFGDFLICPTEPFKKGAVQTAKVMSISHRHYVHLTIK